MKVDVTSNDYRGGLVCPESLHLIDFLNRKAYLKFPTSKRVSFLFRHPRTSLSGVLLSAIETGCSNTCVIANTVKQSRPSNTERLPLAIRASKNTRQSCHCEGPYPEAISLSRKYLITGYRIKEIYDRR